MRVFTVAVFGALFLVSGCVGLLAVPAAPGVLVAVALPAPEPGPDSLMVVQTSEPRVIGDIRGVALHAEAGGQLFEFSEVSDVRWTPSELVITGTVDARGSANHGQITTARYLLADINYVIVRDYSGGDSSLLSLLSGLGMGLLSGLLFLGSWILAG